MIKGLFTKAGPGCGRAMELNTAPQTITPNTWLLEMAPGT